MAVNIFCKTPLIKAELYFSLLFNIHCCKALKKCAQQIMYLIVECSTITSLFFQLHNNLTNLFWTII